MPLPSTMTPIATNTLTTAAASVTFSNLPQGYTDLRLVATPRTTNNTGYFNIYPNNTKTSIYSRTIVGGASSASYSNRSTNTSTGLQLDASPSGDDVNATPVIVDFMNYSNTSVFKTALARTGSAASFSFVTAYVWLVRDTAAITSLVIEANTTTFTSGTTFTIYGVKAA